MRFVSHFMNGLINIIYLLLYMQLACQNTDRGTTKELKGVKTVGYLLLCFGCQEMLSQDVTKFVTLCCKKCQFVNKWCREIVIMGWKQIAKGSGLTIALLAGNFFLSGRLWNEYVGYTKFSCCLSKNCVASNDFQIPLIAHSQMQCI